ncbi:MAG: hypothetical protein ACHQ3P_12000 [Candidatus Limnocylindrales bacterium]
MFVVIGVLIGGSIAVFAGAFRPSTSPGPGGVAGSLLPAETGTPEPIGGPSTAAPTSGSTEPAGSGSPLAGVSAGSVTVDPSLLAVLPPSVGGIVLSPDPDTAAQDAADPSHAADLSAIAVAIAAQPTSGDLAVVSVVRLRPGVFSDEYFRSWRDTFDTGACSQAGGVAGTAEATIAGHQAYIGHCAGGLLTYHVHLADGDDRIVSISSLGPGRLGQLVVEGLQ